MTAKHKVGAIFFFYLSVFFAIGCENNEVAIYDVRLKMMWSEDRFPQDYLNPYNGNPQWSPVFGQSHNRSYILYRLGEMVQPAASHLIQDGGIDDLMLQGEEDPRIYDQFSAPGVGSGLGDTQGMVVVDGEHSLVSLILRMLPTSGWFVGVDSLNLCIDSSWVDQITLDLEPLTIETSKLYSAENYMHSYSAEPVRRLAATRFNNHDAGFFKTFKALPAIAKVEFTKKEVYSSEDINKLVRNDVLAKLKQENLKSEIPRRKEYVMEEEQYFKEATTRSYVDHLMDLEEEPFGTPAPGQPENNVVVVTKAPRFSSQDTDEIQDDGLMTMDDAVLAVAKGRKLGLNKHLPRHFRSRLHHAVNHRPHRN